MKLDGQRRSSNIDDRRGQSTGRSASSGSPLPTGGMSGLGAGILIRLLSGLLRTKSGRIILIVLAAFFLISNFSGACSLLSPTDGTDSGSYDRNGVPSVFETDKGALSEQGDNGYDISYGQDQKETPLPSVHSRAGTPSHVDPDDPESIKDFLSVVLARLEDTWSELFKNTGYEYDPPTLVLFDGVVQSACGSASSAMGPFYCPADREVYIDMSFFRDLAENYGAKGDFPMAYVLAHEVGHHVQNCLGISEKVQKLQQRLSKTEANHLSVRVELQADYFAGVFAHYAQDILDDGDIDEAMIAAQAIGDDRLQKQASGRVVPDSFTHGSSAQRKYWFMKGFRTGTIGGGDTFSISYDELSLPQDPAALVASIPLLLRP